jgi:hypothetical protein
MLRRIGAGFAQQRVWWLLLVTLIAGCTSASSTVPIFHDPHETRIAGWTGIDAPFARVDVPCRFNQALHNPAPTRLLGQTLSASTGALIFEPRFASLSDRAA